MEYLSYALLGVAVLVVVARIRGAQRRRQVARHLPEMRRLVAEQRYQQALDLLERVRGLRQRYKLTPEQSIEVADLETEALVGVGRDEDAVVQLGHHLAARFTSGRWPARTLERWLALYRQAGPIPVEAFYFCEVCGLDPGMTALLQHAIDSGCPPPVGFPGTSGSAVVVHFGPRKVGD